MSNYLDAIRRQAQVRPGARAFCNSLGERLSYGELWERSDALACWIAEHDPAKTPVCLYGHKQAAMLVGMLACMKAGVPYAPIDTSFPKARIALILGQLDAPVVLCAAEVPVEVEFAGAGRVVAPSELAAITKMRPRPERLAALRPIAGDDPIYLLFTSGSTGTPKGVVQRAESVDLTSAYFSSLAPVGAGYVCFNRAPFSFDLSIFDLLVALPGGHTMFALDEATETSLSATFKALAKADPTLWVSTPSFLALCLADPSFNRELLPSLSCAMICGETLGNATARAMLERFPDVRLINLYGPSETCGAVTDVRITPELAARSEALPIGRPSPYSRIVIADPETLAERPCGEPGEILIVGNTAAAGYYRLPEKTAACFSLRACAGREPERCYRTGDEGYVDADGMLHYLGRLDLQLKMNGYRIELGDIEENLNSLPEVATSCVVPVLRDGACTALAAHVVPARGVEPGRALTKQLKAELGRLLPVYMVPRTFAYHEALPATSNGKVDRKALQAASAPRTRRAREA